MNDKGSYSYIDKIRYFVLLYAIILGLSIWGLVSNVSIRFNSLVVGLSITNFINLSSLAILEATLLLIPSAIISLYYLMQILFFKAKIRIDSKEKGSKILLKRKREPNEKIDLHNINFYDTNLTTPSTLMLTRGKYILKLELGQGRETAEREVVAENGAELEIYFPDN
jgi:hypothetical protein